MSQIELTIHEIMLDFEVAAHNAARKVFCDVRITACKFHLGQSWYRRITKSKFLYIAYNYKGDENIVLVEIRNWLKLFFSLSYLKPEHVIDAFLHLEALLLRTTPAAINSFYTFPKITFIAILSLPLCGLQFSHEIVSPQRMLSKIIMASLTTSFITAIQTFMKQLTKLQMLKP